MAVTEWWEENPGCVWQALANLQSPGALHCHKYYMLDACRPCFTQAPSAHSYLHCRHLWFRDGQKLRMAKTRKPGAGLLWETQSLSPTKIQRGQLPHYSGRTLHSRLFHMARLPAWYLSALEHPQAVYPLDSTISASFRNRICPNQSLDTIQESFLISHFSASIPLLPCWTQCQHWACPLCQHSHSPWAHRTTCLLHGYPCRESCHCEEALRGASARCGSTADWREITALGTADGTCSRRRTWKQCLCFRQGCWGAQCWKYGHQRLSGCGCGRCLSERGALTCTPCSEPGGGGFVLAPFNRRSNAWWKQETSGTARPWHPWLWSTVGVSEPNCLGHCLIDFL